MLLAICGPAGAGKSKFAASFVDDLDFKPIIPCTTRKMRPKEINGKDYHFYTNYEFKYAEQDNKFINVEEYTGERFYAFRKSDIENAVSSTDNYVVVCTPRGLREIKKQYDIENLHALYASLCISIVLKGARRIMGVCQI